ncbi:hypothetical protein PgNI_06677 [Pyricularia grisea]|uniref:C2H2-type domain-containing protein n=1 Tax=Pyricularia grisea TaxID=148305 RepID=A0A6P8B789_PYRGI|nr:hypothetical protein PgNI_06677 [Pyricularia grisea]TLD10994.1 hypothetical protein PgNI_06677 [Pyricularia grisea]
MQISNIVQLMILFSIGALAFPTPAGSGVHSPGIDQTQAGASGSSVNRNLHRADNSDRLQASSVQDRTKRPAWKQEFADQLRQAQLAQKPYQCPHCLDPISDEYSLHLHTEAFHKGAPFYSQKNYYYDRQ